MSRTICINKNKPTVSNVFPSIGETVEFSVDMTFGIEPFFYQWFFNGNPIGGETYKKLKIEKFGANQGGRYNVLVKNRYTSTMSDSVYVVPNNFPTPTPTVTPIVLVAPVIQTVEYEYPGRLGSAYFDFSLIGWSDVGIVKDGGVFQIYYNIDNGTDVFVTTTDQNSDVIDPKDFTDPGEFAWGDYVVYWKIRYVYNTYGVGPFGTVGWSVPV
jgi:hypothetical protein